MRLSISALVLCVTQCLGVDITGQVIANPKLTVSINVDFGQGRVQLVDNGVTVATATITTKGAFLVPEVTAGKYVAYFTHPFFRIEPIALHVEGSSVSASVFDTVRSGPGAALAYPLQIMPVAYQSPYVPEEEFNAFQILKNPMAIMGVVMLALVWLMPKLQGGVSSEEMKDMRKSLEEDGGMAANFLKKMIPSESSGSNSQPIGGSIPSIANKKQQ